MQSCIKGIATFIFFLNKKSSLGMFLHGRQANVIHTLSKSQCKSSNEIKFVYVHTYSTSTQVANPQQHRLTVTCFVQNAGVAFIHTFITQMFSHTDLTPQSATTSSDAMLFMNLVQCEQAQNFWHELFSWGLRKQQISKLCTSVFKFFCINRTD